MSYRPPQQGGFGLGGLLGALLSGFHRPAVQTSEQVNRETQVLIPDAKAWRTGLFTTMLLLASLGLGWTFPGIWRVRVVAIVGGGWAALALFAAWAAGEYVAGDEGQVFENRRFGRESQLLFVHALTVAGVVFFGVQEYDTWVLTDSWPGLREYLAAIRCVLIGFQVAGLVGLYWYVKETVLPFELTGFDKVIREILNDLLPVFIDLALHDAGLLGGQVSRQDLLGAIRAEVGDGLKSLRDGQRAPFMAQPTYAHLREQAEREFHLDLVQFLFFVLTIGGSRRAMTTSYQEKTGEQLTLPLTGLAICKR